jgi:hypothetical protein
MAFLSYKGAHLAVATLARRWCSPRRYMGKEAARHAAVQQRPLHPGWPNPLASCFGDYSARAISQLMANSSLMCSLDHHQNVLEACAALAKGGGSSESSVWPFVLLHCLRLVRLYEPAADPMQRADDTEVLDGGGLVYATLRGRLMALKAGSLPSDGGIEHTSHPLRAHFALLRAALKVIANLAKDISRPLATFGHFVLAACRTALPLTPAACLSVCRAIAPLCFRPATIQPSAAPPSSVFSPPPTPAPAPAPAASTATAVHPGLCVSSALLYASGLGRPAAVAEDFPVALKFSTARVETALRMRPQLPGMLEPLVLSAMSSYPNTTDVKIRSRLLDLAVTLVRCGVDYRRLDPKAALVSRLVCFVGVIVCGLWLSSSTKRARHLHFLTVHLCIF